MGWLRDISGGTVAGVVTLTLFCGAPALGWFAGSLELAQEILVRDPAPTASVWVAPTPPAMPIPQDAAPAEAPAESPVAALPAQTPSSVGAAPSLSVVTRSADPSGPSGARRASVAVHAEPVAVKRKGKRCEVDTIPEIEPHGTTMWSVDRSLIKSYTRNLAKLNSLGWSRQHDGVDGKPDGMVLGGLRCNNDLHRAGLRSGDVVHSVNGHKVKNIPQALLAYTAVRNDRVIKLDITRKGQRKTLSYRLVG